jgi:predicted amidohydrolase YtcJ
MARWLLALLLLSIPWLPARAENQVKGPADLIVHHAKVVTVDQRFRIAQAVAVKDGRVLTVGDDRTVLRRGGPRTRVIDAKGRMVLPGLYDSHMHPLSAAASEWQAPLPELRSLKDVFAAIRQKTAKLPAGDWIVLPYAFPTRLAEARFPTRAELDRAAPHHPVLYNAGPASMVNSVALKISGITKDSPNPPAGVIVKDPRTGEPTGMLRNAAHLLKGVPRAAGGLPAATKRAALRKLFRLYNSRGLTSIGDRNAGREELDLYLTLHAHNELTVR